ncbi:MAG: radical SAM protein [Ignavibacteria bacterium]|nr:radical SAM protein [Ignavibacteria bacterium]
MQDAKPAAERFRPAYLELQRSGELEKKARRLTARLAKCDTCPRVCGKNRLAGHIGKCRSGFLPVVSSASPHYGEEPPLVGRRGSGTIFFTNCNLACIFCQNYDISRLKQGREIGIEHLAAIMLHLQEIGCHNVNLVSPTHFVPQIVSALDLAASRGLSLPIVYNTGGYDSVETLRELDGIVDIYMPDVKYWDDENAVRYSGAQNYRKVVTEALREMHRQVGDLVTDQQCVAYRGLLIRHLVLPNNLAGTNEVLRFIAEEISKESYVNIMDQYRPCFQAWRRPELNRRITSDEHESALRFARSMGLQRGF